MNDVTDVICTLLLCKYPSIDAVYERTVPCLDFLHFLHVIPVILLGDLLGLLDSHSLQSDPFSKPSAVNPRSCQNDHPYLLRSLLFQPKMEKFGRMQQEVEKEVGELKKLESEMAKSLEGKRYIGVDTFAVLCV